MCLIGYNPFGMKLSKSLLRTAYDNNPHGFGFVWLDDDNELSSLKKVSDFSSFWNNILNLEGSSYAFHLRWRTTGDISIERCHPFKILNKKEHGFDLYMMHNGTISELQVDDYKSDSEVYSNLLTGFYESNFYNRPLQDFYSFVENNKSLLGDQNKILFMTSSTSKIINKDQGFILDDVWFSNYYSFVETFREKSEKRKNKLYNRAVYNSFTRKDIDE